MTSTTDFNEWLENGNEPETPDECYALWQASQGESFGTYDVTDNSKGHRFIKGPEGTLALVSPKAIAAFQSRVDDYMPDKELGWEGGAAFLHAMSKDD